MIMIFLMMLTAVAAPLENNAGTFILKSPIALPPPNVKGVALSHWHGKSIIEKTSACLAGLPSSERNNLISVAVLKQLVRHDDAFIPVFIVAYGIKKVDWSSAAAEYLKISGVPGRSQTIDGIIYHVDFSSPVPAPHGKEHIMWSTVSPATKTTLTGFLAGIECLYPDSAISATSDGIKLTYRDGSTMLVFNIRSR